MPATISNRDDVIDSRDVIARIAELEDERDNVKTDWGDDATAEELATAKSDAEELAELVALADEGENSADDWTHGATLIRDSYFQDYAGELAEEIGAVERDATWPHNCIDWEMAARDLRMDYSAVHFGDETYWIR